MQKRSKAKASASKPAPKKAAKKKKPASIKKQSMRDVIEKSTIDQIAKSIATGTTVSANTFRGYIGWQ